MQIIKDNLKDLNVSDNAHKEVVRILTEGRRLNGFRFETENGKCVAIGRKPKSGFNYGRFANNLIRHFDNITRIRFILISD